MVTFICPWFGDLPQRNIDCIDVTRAAVEAAGHTFDLRMLPAAASPQAAAIAKDLLVLELSCIMPDAAFIDGDVEIKALPDLQPGLPYFIREFGTPRIGYFIVNGCTRFFEELQADKIRRGILDVYGYPNKLLRDKTTGIIPDDSYIHHRFTSGNKQTFFKQTPFKGEHDGQGIEQEICTDAVGQEPDGQGGRRGNERAAGRNPDADKPVRPRRKRAKVV